MLLIGNLPNSFLITAAVSSAGRPFSGPILSSRLFRSAMRPADPCPRRRGVSFPVSFPKSISDCGKPLRDDAARLNRIVVCISFRQSPPAASQMAFGRNRPQIAVWSLSCSKVAACALSVCFRRYGNISRILLFICPKTASAWRRPRRGWRRLLGREFRRPCPA